MDYQKLEIFVSKPRLDHYLTSCGNSEERAIELYEANIRLCEAFYPILNLLETFLRNVINDKLATYFNDNAWIINQKTGFMNDPSLAPTYGLKNQVISVENNARGAITPGKIVSGQTFGFWASFFDRRHYRLIGGYVIHCFPNKPATVNKNDIGNMLRGIRELRNRIYHNEAICFDNSVIDFRHVRSVKADIYKLLDWMDVDLKTYVSRFDSIDVKINEALTI